MKTNTAIAAQPTGRDLSHLVALAQRDGVMVADPEILAFDTEAWFSTIDYPEILGQTMVFTQSRGILLCERNTTDLIHDTLKTDTALSFLTGRPQWKACGGHAQYSPMIFGNRVFFPVGGTSHRPTHWVALHHCMNAPRFQGRVMTLVFSSGLTVSVPVRHQYINEAMVMAVNIGFDGTVGIKQLAQDMAINVLPSGKWFRALQQNSPTARALKAGKVTRQAHTRQMCYEILTHHAGCLNDPEGAARLVPDPTVMELNRGQYRHQIWRMRRLK